MELQNLEVEELSLFERKETVGGSIFVLAFFAGVAYGYAKEKFAKGEWSI